MGRQKTNKVRLEEGRCQGIGPDYVPFYKANEARSIGTASMIPDPFEGRMIHVLSKTEGLLYYLLRWDDNVEHIREQYLLDTDYVNKVRHGLGLKAVSSQTCYTTDFLVDYKDGSQHAYSVKWKLGEFNADSIQYKGRKNRYAQLIERQMIEKQYWETQGVSFSIITIEHINTVLANNIAFVMGFYDDLFVTNTEQKLMYLVAHKIITVPMDKAVLKPKELVQRMTFDIDAAYEKALCLKEEYANE